MGDLPGFGGIWRTLVGEWEKFYYFYICFWINGWRQGKMGDLPGVRGMWRTLVGQWEKKFNYFYICICIRILIQICIWIRGRWRTGDNGRAQVREGWRRGRGRVKKGP